jgi:hypothetical protein
MATTLRSGEQIAVLMELGFPVNVFTLDSAADGVLDDDYLDGTLLGDDVSPYIQNLTISRGRSSQLDQFSAGRCSVTLVNNDRRFDPINEDSPYWDVVQGRTGILPRRKVTVQLNGIDVYVGRIADIDVNYDFNLSTVSIAAADDFVLLANAFTSTAFTPSQQLSGARVTGFLDRTEIAYPATRDIDAGTATLGGYQVDANTNALAYLQQCAEAERGLFFIKAGGDLRFTNRADYIFAPAVITTFSDAGGGIPYQSLDVSYGQEFLYNRIQVTRDGGTQQAVNDNASQTEFGVSTYALDNSLLATDAQALTLAQSLLTSYSEPVYRFDNLEINLTGLSNVNRDVVNSLELGDVIQITRTYATGTPASVTQPYAIERISHTLSAGSHTVEFGLRFANIVYQFILNDATYGVLDADNALV